MKPKSLYVASSWKNIYQVAVVTAARTAGIETYDFKDADGFHWSEVDPEYKEHFGQFPHYMDMLNHNRAHEGFKRDFDAMVNSEACVLVLPAGRSANLEAGWFIGQEKPCAVYMPEYDEPDLMYKMADFITDNLFDLLGWLGVED